MLLNKFTQYFSIIEISYRLVVYLLYAYFVQSVQSYLFNLLIFKNFNVRVLTYIVTDYLINTHSARCAALPSINVRFTTVSESRRITHQNSFVIQNFHRERSRGLPPLMTVVVARKVSVKRYRSINVPVHRKQVVNGSFH